MRPMMRRAVLGLSLVGLAGCGRAPGDGAGDAVSTAGGLAFTYSYAFRLPADRIADAQDAHAVACERLGPRCRITGMTFRVDDAGVADASLDLRLAAPIARAFGRQGVKAIETAGGALVGADIGGSDTVPAVAAGDRAGTDATADRSRLERELARSDLPAAERATLRAQLAAVTTRTREADAAVAAARASVETTPMHFSYRAGHGVGIAARVADAGRTLAASTAATLGFTLTVLATLGPPALVLLLLIPFWHRWGRRLWQRLLGPGQA